MTYRCLILCRVVPLLIASRHAHPVCAKFVEPLDHLLPAMRKIDEVPCKWNSNEDNKKPTSAIIADLILNHPRRSASWPGRPNNNYRRLPSRGMLSYGINNCSFHRFLISVNARVTVYPNKRSGNHGVVANKALRGVYAIRSLRKIDANISLARAGFEINARKAATR